MRTLNRVDGPDVKIYAKSIDDNALAQIVELGACEIYKDSSIRIMPDCHAGIGCTIGTTMTIKDRVSPNLVGVDIGCGMLSTKLDVSDIDLKQLDEVIDKYIPSGFNIHNNVHAHFDFSNLRSLGLNIERAKLSIGSLGGGNHFIEVGRDSKGELYLVIHSGSRNIGGQVARFYQDIAIKNNLSNKDRAAFIIEDLKKQGRHSEIEEHLSKTEKLPVNKALAHVSGEDFLDYMNDMKIMQEYASLNRRTIASIILEKMNIKESESFETIHNYIDFKRMILRKGAVSAEKDELLLIPINMRDGSIIAKGKGNEEWNYSAPHGAGRLMGRTEAKKNLNMKDFREQMKNIYSSSITEETLDEAPNAYKPIEEIIEAIKDTVDIIDIIKPIYNYKAH